MYNSLSLGVVVAVYPEANSVDVLLVDEGRRLRGVQVMVPTGSSSTGVVDLPEVGGPKDETRWDIDVERDRYVRALVAFCRGVPVVIGFLLPQVNQCTFKQPNRRVVRHASDVYSTVDDEGNIEVYHPSGTYLRIGTAPEHEDLTGKDFDKKWAIERNTDKQVHVHLEVVNGDTKASINISPEGVIDVYAADDINVHTEANANVNVDGDANVHVKGDADAHVEGDAIVQVDGNSAINTDGNAEVTSGGTMDLESDGAMTLKSGASIKLEAPRIDLN